MGVKEQKHIRKMGRQPKRWRAPCPRTPETRECGHRRKLSRVQPRPAGAAWGHRSCFSEGIIYLVARLLTGTWALSTRHNLGDGQGHLQTRQRTETRGWEGERRCVPGPRVPQVRVPRLPWQADALGSWPPSRIGQLPAHQTPSAPPAPGASLKPVLLLTTWLLSSEIIGSEAIMITPALERRCRY